MSWIVHCKGKSDRVPFEICVIRDDFEFGIESYGWFGKDKILISHSGGPCHYSVLKLVWDKLMTVAQDVADKLNGKDF